MIEAQVKSLILKYWNTENEDLKDKIICEISKLFEKEKIK